MAGAPNVTKLVVSDEESCWAALLVQTTCMSAVLMKTLCALVQPQWPMPILSSRFVYVLLLKLLAYSRFLWRRISRIRILLSFPLRMSTWVIFFFASSRLHRASRPWNVNVWLKTTESHQELIHLVLFSNKYSRPSVECAYLVVHQMFPFRWVNFLGFRWS